MDAPGGDFCVWTCARGYMMMANDAMITPFMTMVTYWMMAKMSPALTPLTPWTMRQPPR